MKKLLLLAVLSSFAFATAVRAEPCPGTAGWVFDDVDAADTFCAAATWLAVQGITQGCETIDENHRNFCPDSPTTRLQMSAFLKRLADATAPVKAYASVYNDSGYVMLLGPAYNSIPMTATAAANGVLVNPFAGLLVLANGDYRAHYCVRLTALLNANTRLVVNGTELAGSSIVRNAAGDTWCRDVIVPLAVADTLELQMSSGVFTPATLLGTGGAELTLERIGP